MWNVRRRDDGLESNAGVSVLCQALENGQGSFQTIGPDAGHRGRVGSCPRFLREGQPFDQRGVNDFVALENAQRFFQFQIGSSRQRSPASHRRTDLTDRPIRERPLCEVTGPAVLRVEMSKQFGNGRGRKLRWFRQWPAFGRDAPDAAPFAITFRVTEACLIMADDRVVPIGEVQRAIRSEPRVHWSKALVRCGHQRLGIGEREAGAVVRHVHRPHGVVDVAGNNQPALPGVGEVRGLHDLAAAHLAPAPVLPDQGRLIRPALRHESGHRINDRAVVAGEFDGLAPVGEDEAPGILRLGGAAVKAFELQPLRPESPDASLVERLHTPRRFDARKVVQPLAEPDLAARPPAKRIYVLMIVTGAEATEDDAFLVRAIVAVGVAQQAEVRTFTEVAALRVAGHFQSGRDHQAIGEHLHFTGFDPAVTVAIIEDEHLVVGKITRLDHRIHHAADDPQATARIEADLDRLHHAIRFGGEEVHFKSLGHLERSLLDGGIVGIGGVGRHTFERNRQHNRNDLLEAPGRKRRCAGLR